jgi:phosphoribulokinase
MPRPIILGVVGDSASGKTTITRGLVRIIGEDKVTHLATDDYHKYDRQERAQRSITPLHPECNYLDIMTQDLDHLRDGEPILKPVYKHADGTFGRPEYMEPKDFAVVEGLLGYYSQELRDCYDVRVYLAPPEELRRKWKVKRDTSRRSYTTDEVLAELDRREPDSAQFIRPQERYADMVVSFMEGDGGPDKLDAELVLRESLPHPDLSPFIGNGDGGMELTEDDDPPRLRIPGDMEREHAAEIEEALWDRLHFASHLRSERLGEFTVGTDLQRSESLALVQLLILYHLVTAKATVALGGEGTRGDHPEEHPGRPDEERVEAGAKPAEEEREGPEEEEEEEEGERPQDEPAEEAEKAEA